MSVMSGLWTKPSFLDAIQEKKPPVPAGRVAGDSQTSLLGDNQVMRAEGVVPAGLDIKRHAGPAPKVKTINFEHEEVLAPAPKKIVFDEHEQVLAPAQKPNEREHSMKMPYGGKLIFLITDEASVKPFIDKALATFEEATDLDLWLNAEIIKRQEIEGRIKTLNEVVNYISNHTSDNATMKANIAEGSKSMVANIQGQIKYAKGEVQAAAKDFRAISNEIEASEKKVEAAFLRELAEQVAKVLDNAFTMIGSTIEIAGEAGKGEATAFIKPVWDSLTKVILLFGGSELVNKAEKLEEEAGKLQMEAQKLHFGAAKERLSAITDYLKNVQTQVAKVQTDYEQQQSAAEDEFDGDSNEFQFDDLKKGIELAQSTYDLAEKLSTAAISAQSAAQKLDALSNPMWRNRSEAAQLIRQMIDYGKTTAHQTNAKHTEALNVKKNLQAISVAAKQALVDTTTNRRPHAKKK